MIPHSKPFIDEEDINSVATALRELNLATGFYTDKLSKELSIFLQQKYIFFVNSGTNALDLSIKALSIKAGEEVILPSLACPSLLHPIINNKFKPVLVDVRVTDANTNIEEVKKKISKKTKILLLPHTFGNYLEIAPFRSFGCHVIEDCAQALGLIKSENTAGDSGDLSVFSFYATKMLTGGTGGAIATSLEEAAAKLAKLLKYDEQISYFPAFNFKLSDLQAALISSQFKKINLFVTKRKAFAKRYFTEIKNSKFRFLLNSDCESVFFRFILLSEENPDRVVKAAEKAGISIRKPIFKPLHHYLKQSGFKTSDYLFKKMISLPIYPALSDEECSTIIDFLNNFQ